MDKAWTTPPRKSALFGAQAGRAAMPRPAAECRGARGDVAEHRPFNPGVGRRATRPTGRHDRRTREAKRNALAGEVDGEVADRMADRLAVLRTDGMPSDRTPLFKAGLGLPTLCPPRLLDRRGSAPWTKRGQPRRRRRHCSAHRLGGSYARSRWPSGAVHRGRQQNIAPFNPGGWSDERLGRQDRPIPYDVGSVGQGREKGDVRPRIRRNRLFLNRAMFRPHTLEPVVRVKR